MAITGRDSKGRYTGDGKSKDGISKSLQRIANKFNTTLIGAALYRRAQKIMADSKEHYVPVDLGTLKSSGHVAPPSYSGRTVTVELSYGDAASAYALAIHEHPSKHSPPSWLARTGGAIVTGNQGQGVNTSVRFSPAGTGPKYLERPMMAAIPTLPAELAKDLNLEKL